MNLKVHAISTPVDIPICISIEDIHTTTQQDTDLQMLKSYISQSWTHNEDEVEEVLQKYWPIRCELAMIDVTAMNSK